MNGSAGVDYSLAIAMTVRMLAPFGLRRSGIAYVFGNEHFVARFLS